MQIEIFNCSDLHDLEAKVNEFLDSGIHVHNILQTADTGYESKLVITIVYDKAEPG